MNKKDEFEGYVSFGDRVWGFIGLVIIVCCITSCCDRAEKATTPQYTEKERQHLMEVTNTFVNENKASGFIKKVDKNRLPKTTLKFFPKMLFYCSAFVPYPVAYAII